MDKLTLYGLIFLGVYAAYLSIFFCVALYDRKHSTVKVKKTKFDERQRAVQAKAYQLAFFTLLGYLFLWLLLSHFGVVWCDTEFGIIAGGALSLTVFLILCILQDAHIRVGDQEWPQILLINLWSGSTLGLSPDGSLVENGLISVHASGLLLFAMCMVLDVCYLLRWWLKKEKTSDRSYSK